MTQSSIRISFSPDNTLEQIKTAAQILASVILEFRKIRISYEKGNYY
jgi:cysteine sulfinate desulfinase/cysteine desulfurase-like protein